MAHVATHISHTDHNFIKNFFSKIGHFLVSLGENDPRIKELNKLNSLSDEQLAEKGLTRETIAIHVFRSSMYV